jgi:hypothetical protein
MTSRPGLWGGSFGVQESDPGWREKRRKKAAWLSGVEPAQAGLLLGLVNGPAKHRLSTVG